MGPTKAIRNLASIRGGLNRGSGGFVANSKRSPFTQFRGKDGEPRRVSTRPRKAVNEPRADDVVAMCAVGAGMIQRAAEYEDLAKLATVQKK
jgi:hypothetical protein